MDLTKLKQIREDLKLAVKAVEEKHGLTITVGRIGYTDISFTAKLEGSEVGAKGENLKLMDDWNRAVELGYVKREWLNLKLSNDLVIIGYDFKKRKNSIILTDGKKKYCASDLYVQQNI